MISFIILNYKSTNDTIECINSINKIKTKKKKSIIVVDNNSLSSVDSKRIRKLTSDLILLDENLGFAKGNNIGCEYAIKKYKPDYLCVLNSDIVINQSDFIDKIYDLDNRYGFDVLGPKILPIESESNNPFPAYKTLKEVEDKIIYTKRLITIYRNPVLRSLLPIYIKIKKLFKKENKHIVVNKNIVGEPLHGCSLIFSIHYYKKYKDIFYNETFLFHEEEFLYYRCQRDNLVFLYSPEIELIHKEGQSLNNEFKNNYKKLIFKNEEILKSLLLLEKVMKEEKSI